LRKIYKVEKNMNKTSSVFTVLVLFSTLILAQGRGPKNVAEELKIPELAPVDFLAFRPVIDGQLDDSLDKLPSRSFNVEEKSSPENPHTSANYRMAYGTDFFYLYIETDGDSFAFRDRSFQYGDGFNLLLALTEDEQPRSDEFFVLAGGAVNEEALDWSRSVYWVYNIDTLFKPAGDNTKVEYRAHQGRLYFEVLLPWKDVYPYHPWISEGLGFNLRLIKAIGPDHEFNQLTVLDDFIAKAGETKAYIPLTFNKPDVDSLQSYAVLERNNVTHGKAANIVVATVAPSKTDFEMDVELRSDKGNVIKSSYLNDSVKPGVSKRTFQLPDSELILPGSYEIHWSFGNGKVDEILRFNILGAFDFGEFTSQIESARDILLPSSLQTLQFLGAELEDELSGLRSYDLGAQQVAKMTGLLGILNSALQGMDELATTRGLSRRAFRSKLDGTLQPYAVIVPQSYDASKKYPLVVYLHGSDSTEMDLRKFQFVVPECCIGVGPFARGKRNFYLGDEPQNDIYEAIDAVASSYSVDTNHILVTGFSMGGWGSFLTYSNNPDRFLGLASFSGVPYIPGYEQSPDFREDTYLDLLRDAEVFISHGRKDNVGTIEVMDDFVSKLRTKGVKVEYVVNDERGHSRPSESEIRRYRQWLLELISPNNK
jgi:predicted esterase